MVIQKPGRYLVAVSCLGDGGSGTYRLERQVLTPKEFRKGVIASGKIAGDEIQVWKFTVTPNDPLLVRWVSPKGGYVAKVTDDEGRPVSLPLTNLEGGQRYGILRVIVPTTYLIVLTGDRQDASYTIELLDLPGYKGR